MARTFGDDPVVQTVLLFFLLSPGLRHLQTAKRDGGVWSVRGGWGVRFGKRSLEYVRVSRGGTHACGSTQVRVRGRGAQGSQGGEMPEKKTVRRQNDAFRIFARTSRTRATPNDERLQGIRSSRGNATHLERASRWLDRKGV